MLNRYCENEIGRDKDGLTFNIIESALLPKTLIISNKEIKNESEFKEVLEENLKSHEFMLSEIMLKNN